MLVKGEKDVCEAVVEAAGGEVLTWCWRLVQACGRQC